MTSTPSRRETVAVAKIALASALAALVALSPILSPIGSGMARAQGAGDALDPQLQECLKGMLSGYPSGLQETYCRGTYDLPSAFFFKCARQLRIGFETDAARAACETFFVAAGARAADAPVRR